jgi:hypothetical protein
MLRHVPGALPHLPGQSGYNKRLHAALPLLKLTIRAVAADTDLWVDTTLEVDSTPVECGRSRPIATAPNWPAGPRCGYCTPHSRWFLSLAQWHGHLR